MRAGELNELVSFSSPSSSNVLGELTTTWTSQGDVWAKIISQRGEEAFESSRTNARETLRVCIRNGLAVTTKWRMEWLDNTYNVKVVDRSQLKSDGVQWLTVESVGAL